jgi:hypothetical protein
MKIITVMGEINGYGLKDTKEYKVNDTVGLENVNPVLVLHGSTFLANFQHDWNNPQDTKPQ